MSDEDKSTFDRLRDESRKLREQGVGKDPSVTTHALLEMLIREVAGLKDQLRRQREDSP